MMDMLRDLVRNVSLVVLIASFIDLLMPGQKMDRYLKLIVGLFIIISVLNPILTFLNLAQSFEVTAWQYERSGQAQMESIFQHGEELAGVAENAAWHDYKSRMERQIVSLARLVPGVKGVQVDVQVEKREKAYYGSIRQVTMVVSVGQSTKKEDMVDPVRVNIDDETAQHQPSSTAILGMDERMAIKKQVREVVSNFYGLQPDSVVVTVITGKAIGGDVDEGKTG
ncbi:stage III sporulation protein AF [Metallumcola ferriviriculae]|uniref:Stage III sporulation protein AF n=1 Tax=Metallumcola ferriviriculae TaxID=3039180 RepID=A0AAU0US21_9FIRM|nr:stage III sporulation protein AF [Desulfitibacteraceae bacterium MK1]